MKLEPLPNTPDNETANKLIASVNAAHDRIAQIERAQGMKPKAKGR